MCSPVPYKADPVHDQMQELADASPSNLAPHTGPITRCGSPTPTPARELGRRRCRRAHEVEPIYGPTYLPRKFKIGIGLPATTASTSIRKIWACLAICEEWQIVGYNVLVGGGFGVTPSAKKTFPAVAQPMAFVTPDAGDRRRHGDRQGAARFRQPSRPQGRPAQVPDSRLGARTVQAKVEEYYGAALAEPRPVDVHGFNDHMGWHEQGEGKWFYGLNVENGRIKDRDRCGSRRRCAKSAHAVTRRCG